MNTTNAAASTVRWDADLGAHRVTGFDEADRVLRGSGWSSDPRLSPLSPAAVREMPPGSLLFTDPPAHTRLRGLVATAFTRRAIERLRPRVAAIVGAGIDGLSEIGPDVDVLHDLAYPVTLAVITELLDIGVEGAELFADQTSRAARALEVDATDEDMHASAAATTELTLFLTPVIADRRANPGDDFVSGLLSLTEEPDGLALGEVLATCILLLAAGHETTANVIGNSTLALAGRPARIDELRAHPDRAVEELLRLEGSVKVAARTATTGQDLGGQHVAPGEAAYVHLHDANRDPRRYPDPHRMDLTRDPRAHLSFGAGPHFCLGAALARMEIVETLTALFTRFPGLAVADPRPRWRDSGTFHGLDALPVHLRPGA